MLQSQTKKLANATAVGVYETPEEIPSKAAFGRLAPLSAITHPSLAKTSTAFCLLRPPRISEAWYDELHSQAANAAKHASDRSEQNVYFLRSSFAANAKSSVNDSTHDHSTQDPVPIYWANIVTLVACYGYGFTAGKPDGAGGSSKNQPKWLKFIFKVGLKGFLWSRKRSARTSR